MVLGVAVAGGVSVASACPIKQIEAGIPMRNVVPGCDAVAPVELSRDLSPDGILQVAAPSDDAVRMRYLRHELCRESAYGPRRSHHRGCSVFSRRTMIGFASLGTLGLAMLVARRRRRRALTLGK
ncbi:MAG: hypothetical protein K8W52_02680 [Deltaproteobacteria bacterium]|nr:hypothetical protein [Deltaproteobacteria bacterium]